jgi:endo-1,3(4)-beta-glucanase
MYLQHPSSATMANFAISLLAILPLASGLCLPAGEIKEKRNVLNAREITISTLPPTISYSTAIKTLQSATVSETPSLTGVCTTVSMEIPIAS